MPKKIVKQISKVYFDRLDKEGQEAFNKLYDEYLKQPIFILREVARDMGLRSATTMTKAALVEKMVQTRLNNTILRTSATNKQDTQIEVDPDESLIDDYLQKTFIKNPISVTGTVYLFDNKAYVCKYFSASAADVYMPMRIVNDYNLSAGDFIGGQARELANGQLGLYMIESINGMSAKRDKESLPFEIFDHTPHIRIRPEGNHTLETISCLCPFYYGERRIIINKDGNNLTDLACKIISSYDRQGAKTAALFFDQTDNHKRIYQLANRAQPLSPQDFDKANDAALLALEHIKKAAAANDAALLLINNADILDENVMRKIFAAPRFINNGSVSIIFLSTALELDQKINKLVRIADSVVELNPCQSIRLIKKIENKL